MKDYPYNLTPPIAFPWEPQPFPDVTDNPYRRPPEPPPVQQRDFGVEGSLTPEIRFAWESRQTPERLLPRSVDDAYLREQVDPVQPQQQSAPTEEERLRTVASVAGGKRAAAEPLRTPEGKPPETDAEYERALQESKRKRMLAAIINLGASLFGAKSDADLIERAAQAPMEEYRSRQAMLQRKAAEEQARKQESAKQAEAEWKRNMEEQRQQLAMNAEQRAVAEEQRRAGKYERENTEYEREQAKLDPNSQENQDFRAYIQSAYPDQWAKLPEETRARFTTGMADQKLVEEFFTDAMKKKRAALSGGIRDTGTTTGEGMPYGSRAEVIQDALRGLFPPGTIDEETENQIQTLEAQNAKAGSYDKRLEDIVKKKAARTTEVTEKASQKYAAAIDQSGIAKAWQQVKELEDAIAAGKRAHGGDIPGSGKTGTIADIFGDFGRAVLSPEGKRVKRELEKLAEIRLRDATGAAAPDSEKKTYRYFAGANLFSTDADMEQALGAYKRMLREHERFVSRRIPQSGIDYYEKMYGKRPWAQRKAPKGFK